MIYDERVHNGPVLFGDSWAKSTYVRQSDDLPGTMYISYYRDRRICEVRLPVPDWFLGAWLAGAPLGPLVDFLIDPHGADHPFLYAPAPLCP